VSSVQKADELHKKHFAFLRLPTAPCLSSEQKADELHKKHLAFVRLPTAPCVSSVQKADGIAAGRRGRRNE
jgi:hypothetical protein